MLGQVPHTIGFEFPTAWTHHPVKCEKQAYEEWMRAGYIKDVTKVPGLLDTEANKPGGGCGAGGRESEWMSVLPEDLQKKRTFHE